PRNHRIRPFEAVDGAGSRSARAGGSRVSGGPRGPGIAGRSRRAGGPHAAGTGRPGVACGPLRARRPEGAGERDLRRQERRSGKQEGERESEHAPHSADTSKKGGPKAALGEITPVVAGGVAFASHALAAVPIFSTNEFSRI